MMLLHPKLKPDMDNDADADTENSGGIALILQKVKLKTTILSHFYIPYKFQQVQNNTT